MNNDLLIATSMSYARNIHINIIYQISSIQPLPTYQYPYIQETRKIDT